MALQQGLAPDEDHKARQHADAGQSKSRPPAERLAKQAAEDRRPEGAEIDAVIIEGETGIAARIALRVELADDGRDVGLQIPDAHDDQRKRQVEDPDKQRVALLNGQFVGLWRHNRRQRSARRHVQHLHAAIAGGRHGVAAVRNLQADLAVAHQALGFEFVCLAGIGQGLHRRLAFDGHGEVARHQQQGAKGDGLARAQPAVGQDPAQQRRQIDQGGVGGVLALTEVVREQEMFGQIEDQQRPHAVVGEPLPHLGEK